MKTNLDVELEKIGVAKTGKPVGSAVVYRSSFAGRVSGRIKSFGITCLTIACGDGSEETIPYEQFKAALIV